MCRGGRGIAAWAAALVLAAWPAGVCGQAESPPDALETYLLERELKEPLAAYLRERLATGSTADRSGVAERLGRLYVEMMDEAQTPERRAEVERLSAELIRIAPDAETFELRINLSKARYLFAEEVAEKHRLRLASAEERREAEQTLRTLIDAFTAVGTAAHRRVESLERLEESGRAENSATVRRQLADARRARSLAMYYAGWSSYYLALLTGVQGHAADAMKSFGWILNASPGEAATVDRMPKSLLGLEHVARAALGCAMAEALRGGDGEAMRWLEAVSESEDLPPAVREQLFARRIVVLGTTRRWADLEFYSSRRRSETGSALPVRESRLIAVYALEALTRPDLPERTRPLVESIARQALADLVSLGEIGHVVDLVSQFGSAQLGDEGFISNYVRGLHAYEGARERHGALGEADDRPTEDDAMAVAYRSVATALEAALDSPDAAAFPRERANAGLLVGLALFYAGELERAARRLEGAYGSATDPKQAEEILWMAVVAMDLAAERGGEGLSAERDRLAALYLQSYPGGDRAAKLLLRQMGEGAIDVERAVEILLAVPADSPIYEASRRQSAQLLYRLFRGSRGRSRDFAAARFLPVAEEVLELDRARIAEENEEAAREAAQRVVDRVRQILDVVTGMSTPDLARAKAAFEILDATRARTGLELGAIEAELEYRRLQVALVRGQEEEAEAIASRLSGMGGEFARLADRQMYARAKRAWDARPEDVRAAKQVVEFGSRIIEDARRERDPLASDAYASLWSAVARAAGALYEAEGDEGYREAALILDRELIEAGRRAPESIRRHARLCESAGRNDDALNAWRMLLAGSAAGSEAWYEARYESLRLLAKTDRQRAIEAMAQHRLLHPEYGPQPWGDRLRELDAELSRGEP